jgi:hypothetical protein
MVSSQAGKFVPQMCDSGSQKGERASNQAVAPEFSDSNILPVDPNRPKTRNE